MLPIIHLDEAAIERALPLVSVGLEKYWRIQAAFSISDIAADRPFQKQFNGFYRVRRGQAWQSVFYTLMRQEKLNPRSFEKVLRDFYVSTGRVEASFVSKLTATVDPDKPVIDAFVLENLGLKLLPYTEEDERRLAKIVTVHDRIGQIYAEFLATNLGGYLVARFRQVYPHRQVTRVKMLDLVLWQTRDNTQSNAAVSNAPTQKQINMW